MVEHLINSSVALYIRCVLPDVSWLKDASVQCYVNDFVKSIVSMLEANKLFFNEFYYFLCFDGLL